MKALLRLFIGIALTTGVILPNLGGCARSSGRAEFAPPVHLGKDAPPTVYTEVRTERETMPRLRALLEALLRNRGYAPEAERERAGYVLTVHTPVIVRGDIAASSGGSGPVLFAGIGSTAGRRGFGTGIGLGFGIPVNSGGDEARFSEGYDAMTTIEIEEVAGRARIPHITRIQTSAGGESEREALSALEAALAAEISALFPARE